MKYYICTILVLLFCSCKDSSCEGPDGKIFFEYGLTFNLVDENDRTLIGANTTKYRSSDVRLETIEGEVLPFTEISDDGMISFIPMILEDWSELPGLDVERNFFLFLPDTSYTNGYDVDTLKQIFRAETCEVGPFCCGGFQFEKFDVFYNGIAPHFRDDDSDISKEYSFRK
jgi:hypothetical protein